MNLNIRIYHLIISDNFYKFIVGPHPFDDVAILAIEAALPLSDIVTKATNKLISVRKFHHSPSMPRVMAKLTLVKQPFFSYFSKVAVVDTI
jgi:hypothetical protein